MKYIMPLLLILFVTLIYITVANAKPVDIIEIDCDTEPDQPPKIPSVDIIP